MTLPDKIAEGYPYCEIYTRASHFKFYNCTPAGYGGGGGGRRRLLPSKQDETSRSVDN